MAKSKEDYFAEGAAAARMAPEGTPEPKSGWQRTAWLAGFAAVRDEVSAPKAKIIADLKTFGVTIADARPTRAARDAAKRRAAVERHADFTRRMLAVDKATKALTAVRGRDTGYQSKNIKRGINW